MHFSDKKPKEQEIAQDISHTLGSTNVDESGVENKKHRSLFSSDPLEDKYEKDQKKERRQALKGRCERARYTLKKIRRRINFVDDEGNVLPVTEADRQKKADQLSGEIKKNCS